MTLRPILFMDRNGQRRNRAFACDQYLRIVNDDTQNRVKPTPILIDSCLCH